MKEYNRTTKRWETVEERNTTKGTLKKRDSCRGGNPHHYELALPKYIKVLGTVTEGDIATYYRLEDDMQKYCENHEALLKAHNIGGGYRRFFTTRNIKCSVCGKEDYLREVVAPSLLEQKQ